MFPILSMEQANPGLWGAQRVSDIFNKIVKNQKLGIENRYAPDVLGAKLKKAQLFNQYYPQDIQSQIRGRNATSGLNEAETPWVGKKAQSLIDYQRQLGEHAGALARGSNIENRTNQDVYNTIQKILELSRSGNNDVAGQIQEEPQNQQSYEAPSFNPEQQLSSIMQNIVPQPQSQQNAPMSGSISEQAKNLYQPQFQQMPEMNFQQQGQPQGGIRENAAPIGQLLNQQQSATPQPNSKEQKLSDLINHLSMLRNYGGKRGISTKETPEEKYQRDIKTSNKKQDIRNYADIEKEEAPFNKSNKEIVKDLERMEKLSSKVNSLQGGFLGRHLPGYTDAVQEFNKLSDNIRMKMVTNTKGPLTGYKLAIAENIKPTSKDNPNVRKNSIERLLASTRRALEFEGFVDAAKSKGYSSGEMKALWDKYDSERPEFDSEKGIALKNNINTSRDYLNDNALKAARENKPYSPTKGNESIGGEGTGDIEEEKIVRGKRIRKINGKWHEVF